ncbi:DUF4174 domain-containing protein [Winogradskyella tangerina]|uniref:DUF4174 domain-containing protein n=1 Tax=Winogradskyella tangerina TaxID=2023240 RepID=UPI0013009828|nr:DUF4174 domain-containing protein [Winogradskyella tangerina]
MSVNAQQFPEFKWKNRMVVIMAESENSEKVSSQLELLQAEPDEMNDRKLVICLVLPTKYGIVNGESIMWFENKEYHELLNPDDLAFKIELIGLDGRVKLNTTELLTTEALFAKIDSMPMRQQELKDHRK